MVAKRFSTSSLRIGTEMQNAAKILAAHNATGGSINILWGKGVNNKKHPLMTINGSKIILSDAQASHSSTGLT